LEEVVEAQLPEFYKMLLSDAQTVMMQQSGFSDDEIALPGRR
jgi:hypothetical protein